VEEKDVKKLKREWAKERKSLKASVRRVNRLLRSQEKEIEVADRIVDVVRDSVLSLPPIEIPSFPAPKMSETEEVAVIFISDSHIGKRTRTYNPKVFAKRLRKLERSILSIVSALRSIRPIKKLVVMFGGDLVDGESLFPGQFELINVPVLDQVFSIGLPEFTKFLYFCLENFESVEVQCAKGNHGRTPAAKWTASTSTNWDYVLYKALENATRKQDRMKWHLKTGPDDWKSLFRIAGRGVLLTHGAQIRSYYSTPIYGITRQSMRWQTAYRDRIKLDYFCFGHFHSAGIFRFNQIVAIMNGAWIDSDTYAEERLGVASVPEQTLFFVHPKYGLTARYALSL